MIGAALHEVFALDKGSPEWTKTQDSAATRQPVSFQFFASHLGVWLDVRIHPSPSGLQIYFRDITARLEANLALSRSEEILRLGLEAAGDAAWDWNITTGKIRISGRMVKALGYGESRFDGSFKLFAGIIHPDDMELAARTLTNHLAGRTDIYRCTYRLRAKDGSWRWNLDRGRVIARDPVSNWRRASSARPAISAIFSSRSGDPGRR